MKKPFIEIDADHFSLSQYEVNAPAGYSPPKNKDTGELFPNCCEYHKALLKAANDWFQKFPNCCVPHQKFIGQWWFKKETYNDVPNKILRQLSYTDHHMSEQINKDDWQKDITDYIEYNVSSFGHPAVGLHMYLENLKHSIEHASFDIPSTKKNVLLEFIDSFYKTNSESPPDLNVLYNTYQEWLKIFPFELNSYFGNLKDQYQKTLPILSEKPILNKYTGLSKAKVHSKETLIKSLTDLTDKLLTQINGVTLYEKGLIDDIDKIKLDLIISSRKQKLKEGYNYNSPDEKTQIKKMIQYWFDDEKKFIKEITPLLKKDNLLPKEHDWIKVFDDLAFDTKIEPQAYRTTTVDEKSRYFDRASYKLTLQYLLKLKQEISFLSNERRLAYLKTLDLQRPKRGNTENPTFNQTVYEAQYNYYEFITQYKQKLENSISKAESGSTPQETETLSSFFTTPDWKKYLDALTTCDPPLLNDSYEFIGNQKLHRGVIAAWFKYLKSKGIIHQSLNRSELALRLTACIKNYKISGSSIDNKSELYESHFEKQLIKSCGLAN